MNLGYLTNLFTTASMVIDQLRGVSDKTKLNLATVVQRMYNNKDYTGLEEQLQKLAIMFEADSKTGILKQFHRWIDRDETIRWKNCLGYIGAGSLGINWVGIPLINIVALWLNGILGTEISQITQMNMQDTLAVIASLAGITLIRTPDSSQASKDSNPFLEYMPPKSNQKKNERND